MAGCVASPRRCPWPRPRRAPGRVQVGRLGKRERNAATSVLAARRHRRRRSGAASRGSLYALEVGLGVVVFLGFEGFLIGVVQLRLGIIDGVKRCAPSSVSKLSLTRTSRVTPWRRSASRWPRRPPAAPPGRLGARRAAHASRGPGCAALPEPAGRLASSARSRTWSTLVPCAWCVRTMFMTDSHTCGLSSTRDLGGWKPLDGGRWLVEPAAAARAARRCARAAGDVPRRRWRWPRRVRGRRRAGGAPRRQSTRTYWRERAAVEQMRCV